MHRKVPSIKSCRWLLPRVDEIKLYFDGSALGNPGPAGIGVIYRSNDGAVLGTSVKELPMPLIILQRFQLYSMVFKKR
ncbi:hypothetical protein GIB67_034833 [Kingdonia uniflora]|uniref:RNase H type-1 domain-containing protein n=1 Tax=Kingdonia uniflora TaxID=39325 RepID=A0A7J7ME16_9MAGN|nr:hypothetical protein GIB67_034833 [Kingdonia uniflora]